MNKQDRLAKDKLIASILEEVSLRSGASINEVMQIAQNAQKRKTSEYTKITAPISIINHETLGPLEAIIKYLKEEKGMKFCAIAKLTGRDQRSIGVAYHRAIAKKKERFIVTKEQPAFPVHLIQDENWTVLEHIVMHLLDKYCLRLCDLARLVGKDDRTIWTIRERAKNKSQTSKL